MFLKLKSLTRMAALRQAMSLTCLFLLLLVMIWAFVIWHTRDNLEANVDASLAQMVVDLETNQLDLSPRERRGELYGMITPQGKFGNFPAELINNRGRFSFDTHRGEFEALIVEKDQSLFFVALSRHRIDDPLEAVNAAFLLSAIIAIIASSAFGLYFGWRSQSRLNAVNRVLGELANGRLEARVQNKSDRDDIDQLSHNLDHTADQLQKLVAQTRHLGANIAHDLRTPLARLRAIIERKSKQNDDPALMELDKISATFDAIMRIARVESDTSQQKFTAIDLGTLAQEIFETFEPVVEDQSRKFTLNITNPATIQGDNALLTQCFANLISNALTYGEGEIEMAVTGNQISIQDMGEGVPENEFENIQKPLVRIDQTRQSEGAGLGLALVRAIADRHNAKLIMSNLQPQGFKVGLIFTGS